jgi:GNAT superfamily N-acetyltransferase
MIVVDNNNSTKVEVVDRSNFEEVLPLIARYQQFYEAPVDEEKNRRYFSQFLADHERGILFLARGDDGSAIGFATLYFIPSSLSAQIACTFNDLYTLPEIRSKGAAIALGVHALLYARERGFKSVSWLTSPSNKIAQKIYAWTNAKRSEWYMYDLPVVVP